MSQYIPLMMRKYPRRVGYHTYESLEFSSLAISSAILFSYPSPLSFEDGMLSGSAQTRIRPGSRGAGRWA